MHKIAILKARTDRPGQMPARQAASIRRHRRAPQRALVVVDMQNYFVKAGHQGEVPLAREIVPEYQPARGRAAPPRRPRRLGPQRHHTTRGESWSNYHEYLTHPSATSGAMQSMEDRRGRVSSTGTSTTSGPRTPDDQDALQRLHPAARPTSSATCGTAVSIPLLITGTATNVCCESTARDAMMLNFKVVMVADGLATHTDEEHNATLSALYGQFGDVQTVDEVVQSLERGEKTRAAA